MIDGLTPTKSGFNYVGGLVNTAKALLGFTSNAKQENPSIARPNVRKSFIQPTKQLSVEEQIATANIYENVSKGTNGKLFIQLCIN